MSSSHETSQRTQRASREASVADALVASYPTATLTRWSRLCVSSLPTVNRGRMSQRQDGPNHPASDWFKGGHLTLNQPMK